MDVLYRTVSCETDGWHVESVDEDDDVDLRIFPTRAAALAWCRDQAVVPQPDFAEGGQVLAAMVDDDDES